MIGQQNFEITDVVVPENEKPLFNQKLFIFSDRDMMWKEVQESGDPDGLREYNELFCADADCPHWIPTVRVMDGKPKELYPVCYYSKEGFDIGKKVKFMLHYRLYHLMYFKFKRGSTPIPKALYNAGDPTLDAHSALLFAIFRRHNIRRHFESTQEFWERCISPLYQDNGVKCGWAHCNSIGIHDP